MREVLAAESGPALEDNVDFVRFPDGMPEPPADQAPERLAALLREAQGIQLLYERLEEPGDRELLARILAFRVLGDRRVRLPMTAGRLRALVESAARRALLRAPPRSGSSMPPTEALRSV